MRANAYVLINIHPGQGKQVYERLTAIEEITRIDFISGPFDIIIFLTAPDFSSIGQIVMNKIQSIPGVERTLTCPVFSFEP
ncbi:MAG: Lrp/AsnC ligand binding domain-containing protein [candidate division WOR-3 bacterium]